MVGVGGLELQLIANSLISPMPAIHFLPLSGNRLPVVLFPIKVFQRLAPAAATRSVSEVWVHPAVSLQRSKLLSLPVRETQTHCGRCSISHLYPQRPLYLLTPGQGWAVDQIDPPRSLHSWMRILKCSRKNLSANPEAAIKRFLARTEHSINQQQFNNHAFECSETCAGSSLLNLKISLLYDCRL